MGNFNLACELLRDITLDVREAAFQRGYNKGLEDGERYTCKVDNSPSNCAKSTAWTDMSEGGEKSAKQLLDEIGDMFSEFCEAWVKERKYGK